MDDSKQVTVAAQILGRKGGSVRSTSKSIRSKLNSAKRWATRRWRYGESGRRPVDARLRARLEGGEPGAWREQSIYRPSPGGEKEGSGGAALDCKVSDVGPSHLTKANDPSLK